MRGCVAILLLIATQAAAQEVHVAGVVLDAEGKSVAQADIAPYWSANGWQPGQINKLFESDQIREIWRREGQMSVTIDRRASSGSAGEFSIKLAESDCKLLVMDQERRQGAIVVVDPKSTQRPITVKLQPLVRVRGNIRVRGSDLPPEWTHIYVSLPMNQLFPLGNDRLAGCGSFESRFEFLLPPGQYVLNAYNDPETARTSPDPTVVLLADQSDVDLGTIELIPAPSFSALKEQAKQRGAWQDHTQRFGQPAPEWSVTDAHGLSKSAKLADFRGKWILLYFWGPGCPPCLKSGLPTLTAFYESHAAQRDQFEVVSICLDYTGEMRTVDDVHRLLAPVIKNVWGGKTLPYPVLLDNTMTSFERFGLEGVGHEILIDPSGNLVAGDHTTLAKILK